MPPVPTLSRPSPVPATVRARSAGRGAGLAVLALALWLAVLGGAAAVAAADGPDYRGMVDRIAALLDDAVARYRAGDADGAKEAVQTSYFEIFENLEGPIRVNVSAARNIELEAAFGGIRGMIVEGRPPAEVEALVRRQIAELEGVLPALEQGVRLRAERAAGAPAPEPALPAAERRMEPHWARVIDGIAATLDTAAAAYEAGRADEARALITRAQFDGYKNSLLETAVRRHVSQRQDGEYNAEFKRIGELVRDGKPPRMVRASVAVLAEDLRRTLPGVPLLDGMAAAAEPAAPERDWAAVAADVTAALAEARALHEAGRTAAAKALVQDTYFDLFEASGMEGRIGARDAAFKTALEGHFSRLMALMGEGADAAAFDAAQAAAARDFARAVALLREGGDAPQALFLYALLIILREGVEAMLIVAAILAYLAKTGNADKQRVIVNSVAVALAASVATAVVLNRLLDASAASQEVLEGATMLLAAAILFAMSWWLVSKAEAQRWTAYIRGKVDQSLSTGSLTALWLTSFLAVYREGAETVLFYQALAFDADTAGLAGIAGGFALGCVGLAAIYLAVRFSAARVPIRSFFLVTGALLYAMAFVFAGKGVMELIEGKVLSPTLVAGVPEVPLLGIFPYWQTLGPQLLLVLAALATLPLALRRTA
ncbi:FTR1 family iron permease [Azospirillum sp. ST 5-10]|uniref:FTR1 family iron permease n=1 Tax=unclassified Azospirillum TaxID=2630922 RepID=UPI003F4A5C23